MNNKVELLGHYGGDLTHAQSAWTSTYRDLTDEKLDRVPKLLKFLADNGHETPFEKSSLHFLVDTEIASHIHILKHRIGVSVNAESARYKEIKQDKFYIPEDWKDLPVKDMFKQPTWGIIEMYNLWEGSGIGHPDPNKGPTWGDILEASSNLTNTLYHQFLEEHSETLGRKRAKESARFFKTYNSQLSADVMFNFRSFVHFQRLRNDEHAQLEIREIAQTMLEQVKNIEGNPFEHTLKAFKL